MSYNEVQYYPCRLRQCIENETECLECGSTLRLYERRRSCGCFFSCDCDRGKMMVIICDTCMKDATTPCKRTETHFAPWNLKHVLKHDTCTTCNSHVKRVTECIIKERCDECGGDAPCIVDIEHITCETCVAAEELRVAERAAEMKREQKIQGAVHAARIEWSQQMQPQWDREREKHAQNVHAIISDAVNKADKAARVVQDAVMADTPRCKTLRELRERTYAVCKMTSSNIAGITIEEPRNHMSKTIKATITFNRLSFSATVASIARDGSLWALQSCIGLEGVYDRYPFGRLLALRDLQEYPEKFIAPWKEPDFPEELKLEARRKAEITFQA